MNKLEVDKIVLKEMINRKIIPSTGLFDVTENLIDNFNHIYRELIPNRDKITKSPSRLRFTKKIAGLSLMNLNISRSSNVEYSTRLKVVKPKCGLLYLISNPRYPGIYKIGITRDLDKRLLQYQTADPYRAFKIEHYKFVENSRLEERKILEKYKMNVVKGEWINSELVKNIFLI